MNLFGILSVAKYYNKFAFFAQKHGFQYPRGDTHAAVEALEKAMRVGKTMQKECMNHGQQFTYVVLSTLYIL